MCESGSSGVSMPYTGVVVRFGCPRPLVPSSVSYNRSGNDVVFNPTDHWDIVVRAASS